MHAIINVLSPMVFIAMAGVIALLVVIVVWFGMWLLDVLQELRQAEDVIEDFKQRRIDHYSWSGDSGEAGLRSGDLRPRPSIREIVTGLGPIGIDHSGHPGRQL